ASNIPKFRYLIFHSKSRTVFGLALASVIQACRGYVSVPQPLLDLGNIGIMRKSVCCCRGTQRMHTQAHNLGAEAGFQAVFPNDIPIDRCWIQVPVKAAGPIVLHWPEQSPFDIAPMSCLCQVIFNHPLGSCVNRNEADLGPLAFDAKMHDTLSAVQVLHPQTTEFFAPDAVIQQGSQNGPISDALVPAGGASNSFRACTSPSAGVLPSFPLAIGRFTPSTGLPVTALRSQR